MKMNDAEDKQPSVRRRSLLRGGAVLAGAGLAATAMAQPAAAADGDPVLIGADNAETTATGLTVTDGDADVAALRLTNVDGPSLYLNPLDESWNGPLNLGEIANTNLGPLIAVGDPADSDAATTVTTFLATGVDLDALPTPLAVTPVRLVDTRTAAGRKGIVASSANPFTSDFKLRSGAYLDILVAPTSDTGNVPAVFINLTAVAANGTGFLAAYPSGDYPGTSTLNVVKGQTIANGAFVAVGVLGDYYTIRVYSTAECWVIVDLTGAIVQGGPGAGAGVTAAKGALGARVRARASVLNKVAAKFGSRR